MKKTSVRNTPSVGARGLWKLKTPYDNLLPLNTPLTCTAVTDYPQLMNMGFDLLGTYYRAYELEDSVFSEHMQNDGRIVFVKTDSNKVYSFPIDYLDSYPVGRGVAYVTMGIGIRLGALPTNVDIQPLVKLIKDIAAYKVGVGIHAEAMALSDIYIVENDEHARLENARDELKKERPVDLTKLIEGESVKSQETNDKLQAAEDALATLDTELKKAKDQIKSLEEELDELKKGNVTQPNTSSGTSGSTGDTSTNDNTAGTGNSNGNDSSDSTDTPTDTPLTVNPNLNGFQGATKNS